MLHWPGLELARSGGSNWLQVVVNPAWMSTMGVTGYGSNLVAQQGTLPDFSCKIMSNSVFPC